MRSKLLIGTLALAASALGAGCVAHAETTGYAEADAPVAFSDEPTLVAVEPDVWVVRDYDYAVYYVDGYYWVYRGDVWHRSRAYERGWTRVEVNVVPRVIVSRDHHAYVHYHGDASAQTRKAPREHAGPDEDKHRDRPEHADDHHDDKGKTPGPPDRADDHHNGPPGHDDRPGGNPHRDEAGNDGKKDNGRPNDNVRPNDNDKKDEPKGDDKKKGDKKEKKKGDKR